MAQAPDARAGSPASNLRGRTRAVLPIYRWTVAMVAVAATLLATLPVWGPEMDFPTKVSQRTSTDGSITLDRTARDVASDAIDDAVGWMTKEGAWLFDGLSTVVTYALVNIERALKWTPWPVVVVGLSFLSFAVGRWRLLLFTSLALLFVGFMGLWENTMDTVALMIVAVAIAVSVGLPLGVLGSRSRIADNLMRPILDGMQTMPSFVYLLPGILFFGLGKPAGIFATIVYAIPPVIRLTNLGIRQVSPETVEAARAFGSSPWQILSKVQIPMALPTIMAGINQTTMMALAMVTIASLVAAGGLGDNVNRALQKNEPGNGLIAGLAIVFLAIIIDRLTQAVAGRRSESVRAG